MLLELRRILPLDLTHDATRFGLTVVCLTATPARGSSRLAPGSTFHWTAEHRGYGALT